MVKTLPLPVLMMTGFALALALALNHPAPRAQAGRIAAHAPAALSVAALMGQPFHLLSPLVPSTWLLVGLARVEMGAHQKFTALPAAGVCLVMALAAMATSGF